MLTCENITCIRGEKTVFSGLSFTALPGSVITLRGTNGAGKSSLLRVLANLHPPAAGRVVWDGKEAAGNHDYMHKLLYISDRNALKADLTVLENMSFWAEIEETQALIAAAARYFGLDAVLDMRVGQLSAGWQRRVALSRLLSMPSQVWLLDEPTAHLDEQGRMALYRLIKSSADQGGIIILSTHDAPFIKPSCDIDIAEFKSQ